MCLESIKDPTIQTILKELNWKPECKTCAKNLVKEIELLIEQRQK